MNLFPSDITFCLASAFMIFTYFISSELIHLIELICESLHQHAHELILVIPSKLRG